MLGNTSQLKTYISNHKLLECNNIDNQVQRADILQIHHLQELSKQWRTHICLKSFFFRSNKFVAFTMNVNDFYLWIIFQMFTKLGDIDIH